MFSLLFYSACDFFRRKKVSRIDSYFFTAKKVASWQVNTLMLKVPKYKLILLMICLLSTCLKEFYMKNKAGCKTIAINNVVTWNNRETTGKWGETARILYIYSPQLRISFKISKINLDLDKRRSFFGRVELNYMFDKNQ